MRRTAHAHFKGKGASVNMEMTSNHDLNRATFFSIENLGVQILHNYLDIGYHGVSSHDLVQEGVPTGTAKRN
jgi:hypothetical protein